MTFGFGMGFPRASSAAGGPSLNLQFAGSTTLDPSITFTRASSGSYYNSGGYLQMSQVNLLTQSEQFTLWAATPGAAVIADVVIAPNGTLTADKLNETAINSQYGVYQTRTPISTAYTVSVYAKAAERSWLYLRIDTDAPVIAAWYNLNSGTLGNVGAGVTATITAVGNGWYRCTYTRLPTAVLTYTVVGVANANGAQFYPGTAGSGIYIWGAQLETSTTESTYIPTSATVNGAPRLDYNPSTLQPQGLLIEEARTNSLTYSEDFRNTADAGSTRPWVYSEAAVVANVTSAPSGAITACKILETITNSEHFVYQLGATASIGQTYTHSAYVKAAERTWCFLRIADNSVVYRAWFNLSTGVVGTVNSGVTAFITPVGNGWYRVSLVRTYVSAVAAPIEVCTATADNVSSFAGNPTSGIYSWGAQVELGAFATSYIPSTNTFTSRASTGTYYGSNGLIQTAAIDVARSNYNPANLTLQPTLLLEAAATNLHTYSSDFTNWSGSAVSISANLIAAPDGTLTADKVIPDTTNAAHFLNVLAGTVSATETRTIYAKAGELSWFRFSMGTDNVWFNVASGTIGTIVNLTASIQFVGNGWYRCIISGVRAGNTNNVILPTSGDNINVYTGDGTSGIYIWGAQLETGAAATSYIPTVAASVTRAADLSSSAAATRAQDSAAINTLTPWYNATEGTLCASGIPYSPVANSANQILASLDNGTLNERTQIARFAAVGNVLGSVTTGGVAVFNGGVATVWVIGADGEAVLAYKSSDNSFGFDGVLDIPASTAGVPTVTKLTIGARAEGGAPWSGAISSITYYPRRLSNTELQSITA